MGSHRVIKIEKSEFIDREVYIGGGDTLINAAIGTSQNLDMYANEIIKAKHAIEAGAGMITDHSISGNLRANHLQLRKEIKVPLCAVPIYELATFNRHFSQNDVFDIIEDYLCRGFNILTLHCTALVGDAYGKIDLSKRTIPITSKGGQIILSYMRRTKEQNPLYEHFDKVLKIFKEHKAVISLGPTYRPASVYDNSLDERDPYWEEVYRMSTLVEKAIQADVPIIVEGIGHARIDYIPTYVMKTKHLCHNAPYRVLTVSTDIALGYDHIASAIASSIAVLSGGDIITAVTPSEHIGIPSTMDIQDGVISARIAAHSAELCKGAAIKEDYRMSCIRNKCCSCHGDAKYAIFQKGAENRIGCGVQEAGCSMCGELCALKNKLAKENKID